MKQKPFSGALFSFEPKLCRCKREIFDPPCHSETTDKLRRSLLNVVFCDECQHILTPQVTKLKLIIAIIPTVERERERESVCEL